MKPKERMLWKNMIWWCEHGGKMTEICIQLPEDVPESALKRRIDELVKEEEMRWTLFECPLC